MTGGVRALMWGDNQRSARSAQIDRLLPECRRHPHGAILETHPVAVLRIKPVEHLRLKDVPDPTLREFGILRKLPAIDQGHVLASVHGALHRGTKPAAPLVEFL